MSLQLLIFDCDGVLLDSERIAGQVLRHYVEAHCGGLDMGAYLEQSAGLSVKQILHRIEAIETDRPAIRFPDDAEHTILRQIDARLRAEVQAIDGVLEALAALPEPKAVASNSTTEYLQVLLDKVGLLACFDGRVHGADQVERPKPDPAVYRLAAQSAGVAPHACLVIEDSPVGASAARAAGMSVLGFIGAGHASPSLADRLRETGVDQVFDSMSELPAIVARYRR